MPFRVGISALRVLHPISFLSTCVFRPAVTSTWLSWHDCVGIDPVFVSSRGRRAELAHFYCHRKTGWSTLEYLSRQFCSFIPTYTHTLQRFFSSSAPVNGWCIRLDFFCNFTRKERPKRILLDPNKAEDV